MSCYLLNEDDQTTTDQPIKTTITNNPTADNQNNTKYNNFLSFLQSKNYSKYSEITKVIKQTEKSSNQSIYLLIIDKLKQSLYKL